MYPGTLSPHSQTLVIFPGAERLTLPMFGLRLGERLLITQREIHIHTHLSPRLFSILRKTKHCWLVLLGQGKSLRSREGKEKRLV